MWNEGGFDGDETRAATPWFEPVRADVSATHLEAETSDGDSKQQCFGPPAIGFDAVLESAFEFERDRADVVSA
ncbi:hypothetical protein [Natrinema sp. HArc-T2]|uniref:hypothetical protein n=1 Tax=Natrinema sp. HArc-T2 TaxID=3242701 RepID=UPI00359D32F9